MVRMYIFPDGVVGSGPTISSETLSKACPGVSVRDTRFGEQRLARVFSILGRRTLIESKTPM